MTDWTIILRSMTGRMFSTVTTVITVAVAVALMLVLLSMRDAGKRAFDRGSGNMHLLVSKDASPMVSVLNGIYYANTPRAPIPWAKYTEIASAFPLAFAIPTQIGDSFRGQPVLATSPELFTKFEPTPGEPWKFSRGGPLRAGDEGLYDLVVGAQAARATGLKIGDRISLTHGSSGSREAGSHVHTEFGFTVVGILEPTGSAHDRALFSRIEASWLLHAFDRRERESSSRGAPADDHEQHADDHGDDHAHDEHDHEHGHGDHDHDHDEPPLTLADLTDEDRKITGVYLRLLAREGSNTPANLPQVFDMLRRDTSITVAQPRQELDRLFLIVGNIDQILVGMAAVVMVSSGIAIMLALYNSMEQRRRQIAVLRVLGCSRGRVFGLVLTESAVLGLIGGGAGVVAAMAGAWVVSGLMKQRLGLVIEPALPLDTVILVCGVTVVLAALAGLVPSVMAYRTPVVKNLKPLG